MIYRHTICVVSKVPTFDSLSPLDPLFQVKDGKRMATSIIQQQREHFRLLPREGSVMEELNMLT
jgi:hypothetical protein